MEQSKYDQFISEMDSTLWPLPGQEMHNAAVVKKAVPSLAGVLKAPIDTDPENIMAGAPILPEPLTHTMTKFTEAFLALQDLKVMFEQAKVAPVYLGRETQQEVIQKLISRLERVQTFLFKTVERLDNLTLDSLSNSQ